MLKESERIQTSRTHKHTHAQANRKRLRRYKREQRETAGKDEKKNETECC